MGPWIRVGQLLVRPISLARFDAVDLLAPFLAVIPAQIVFALTCTLLAVSFRMLLDIFAQGAGPFAMSIPFVLVATLFGRLLSGLVCLTITTLFAWYYILPPTYSFQLDNPQDQTRVLINFASGLFVVALAELFRGSFRRAIAERNFLLIELQHRVGNNFASISSLLRLQMKGTEEPAVISALQTTLGRIQSFATLNQSLNSNNTYTGTIDMAAFLNALSEQLQLSLAQTNRFRILCTSDTVKMSRDRATTIGLLVNEVVTNSFKHAFIDRSHGTIDIRLSDTSDGLRLVIRDDGTGVSSEPRTGALGQKLIAMLAQQAAATVNTETGSAGTIVTFQLER